MEKEKLLITSNFSFFPQCFQKTCTSDNQCKVWFDTQMRENIVAKEVIACLTLYHTNPTFNFPETDF